MHWGEMSNWANKKQLATRSVLAWSNKERERERARIRRKGWKWWLKSIKKSGLNRIWRVWKNWKWRRSNHKGPKLERKKTNEQSKCFEEKSIAIATWLQIEFVFQSFLHMNKAWTYDDCIESSVSKYENSSNGGLKNKNKKGEQAKKSAVPDGESNKWSDLAGAKKKWRDSWKWWKRVISE